MSLQNWLFQHKASARRRILEQFFNNCHLRFQYGVIKQTVSCAGSGLTVAYRIAEAITGGQFGYNQCIVDVTPLHKMSLRLLSVWSN